MNFDPGHLLRKSTSRAKSDVANKLVSMLLHELSRKANQLSGLTVNGPRYAKLSTDFFGLHCPYCFRELVIKHVAVEHLDGMNRLRAGLHIPGNVVVSCSDCNREKRRDDQLPILTLAESGWESFLSHDSLNCKDSCKTCAYWRCLLPDKKTRKKHLAGAKKRIHEFRSTPEVASALLASQRIQNSARLALESFYREGQAYAQRRITELADAVWEKGSS